MEILDDLKDCWQRQRSIRKVLRIFGANSKEEITQPLGDMPDEKAMALVLNWLAYHAENEKQIELRMSEPKEQKVYAVGLTLRNSAIYVQYVRDASELLNKTLHFWDFSITYQTLSVKVIESSVERADAIHFLEANNASK